MQRPTLFALAALAASASAVIPPTSLLGYPPSSYPLITAPTFTCVDGSRTIPSSRINDDFCDCPDGSDERGTPACAHLAPALTFHCLNPGYASADIPVSRVNDGICDCCDGADESSLAPSASPKCKDTCLERRVAAEASIASKLATIRAGVTTRGSLLATSAAARAASAARASALSQEAVAHEADIARLRAALAAVEAEEKRLSSKAKAAWAEAHPEQAAAEAAAEAAVEEARKAQEAARAAEEKARAEQEEDAKKKKEEDIDLDKMLEEAMIANGLMEAPEPAAAEEAAVGEDKTESDDELFFPYPKEYQPGFKGDNAAASNDDGDDSDAKADAEIAALEADLESVTAEAAAVSAAAASATGANAAAASPEAKAAEDALVAAAAASDVFTGVKLPESAELRTQLAAAEAALREATSARTAASAAAAAPADPRDAAFLALKDVCVAIPQAQYSYEACFYGSAAQKELGAAPTARGTSLGKMTAITWPASSDPTGPLPATATAVFKGGQSCWRGPQRSLTVTLRCGAETRALSVDEPAICEYTMTVETPAMCAEEMAGVVEAAAKNAFNEYHTNPPTAPAPAAAAPAAAGAAPAAGAGKEKDEL